MSKTKWAITILFLTSIISQKSDTVLQKPHRSNKQDTPQSKPNWDTLYNSDRL